MDKLKPVISSLIEYYYNQGDNAAGGHLHIVLDDGNTEWHHVDWCYKIAAENGDYLGALICDVLLCFSEEEREMMYENDWK